MQRRRFFLSMEPSKSGERYSTEPAMARSHREYSKDVQSHRTKPCSNLATSLEPARPTSPANREVHMSLISSGIPMGCDPVFLEA